MLLCVRVPVSCVAVPLLKLTNAKSAKITDLVSGYTVRCRKLKHKDTSSLGRVCSVGLSVNTCVCVCLCVQGTPDTFLPRIGTYLTGT